MCACVRACVRVHQKGIFGGDFRMVGFGRTLQNAWIQNTI